MRSWNSAAQKSIEAENRPATPQEKAALVKYVNCCCLTGPAVDRWAGHAVLREVDSMTGATIRYSLVRDAITEQR
jgi:hypothetical protein